MIQKHSTSKFATKLKFKIYKPNKNSQFFLCVSTNTDINKLNWRFNHIFLVITNRDFYCMIMRDMPPGKVKILICIFDFLHIYWIVIKMVFSLNRWQWINMRLLLQGQIQKKNWHWTMWNFKRYCAMHLRADKAHLGWKASRRLA